MPKVHTPLPQELAQEFTKAASILDHFIKGTTKLDATLIPQHIIANAKGVAVLTILKAGFIWSGRAGAGLVVARLPDGRWSAPSAIAAGGAGVGAQIGAECTDSVFILNADGAVRAFSHGGNVSFGANLSVAAGPVGRSAEGAGTVGNLAPIYAYSKTKGLFAGISFEGLLIITRKETNARFYGPNVTPADLLSGKIEPPVEAECLFRALNAKGFGSRERVGESNQRQLSLNRPASNPVLSTSKPPPPLPIKQTYSVREHHAGVIPPRPTSQSQNDVQSSYGQVSLRSDPKPEKNIISPEPPKLPSKPAIHGKRIVVAQYNYDGERPGDLSFVVGDRIAVISDSGGSSGWWEGELRGQRGVFPSNYTA
ncbi:SH3 domain-containing YSC84-like protein 1 [Entophlyctis luteolus]|nr:SH3 domain-containing YSC84-like protein 1 [Entophlyctis luteolus]